LDQKRYEFFHRCLLPKPSAGVSNCLRHYFWAYSSLVPYTERLG